MREPPKNAERTCSMTTFAVFVAAALAVEAHRASGCLGKCNRTRNVNNKKWSNSE